MMKIFYVLIILSASKMMIFSQDQPADKQNAPAEIMTLVEAERAFAKSSTEIGPGAAFQKYFAADGLNFSPGPVIVSQGETAPVVPAEKQTRILNWEPIYADLSQNGDLGYTTGPFQVIENNAEKKVLRTGFYFSVWQKQADSSWKVLLDMGVPTPPLTAPESRRLKLAPATTLQIDGKKATAENLPDRINRLEQEFSALSEKQGETAYQKFAREDIRLHRFTLLPILGKSAALSHVSAKEAKTAWSPLRTGISASRDFAWSYGTYRIIEENAGADDTGKGYYVRVWRIGSDGQWKLVAEVTNPLKVA